MDEIPKPRVIRDCLICARVGRKRGWPKDRMFVSPRRTAHFQKDEQNSTSTVCGLDASGRDWWWPL